VKRAVLRPAAERDLIDATRWYAGQGGLALGAKAFDAAHAALEPTERMPGLGAPRLGNECGLPGLRQSGVGGFPMSWFYFERDDRLDVVRLLGDRRDIATIFADDVREPD
jgi:toxin ParE1/3/4